MKTRKLIGAVLALFFCVTLPPFIFAQPNDWLLAQQSTDNKLQLWYDKPAEIWEEALPLGNGQTGAMVFGSVSKERYQLNDHTLWSGGPDEGNNPAAAVLLPQLREQLFRNDYGGAEETWRKMQGPYSARYLPLGDFWLDFDETVAAEYKRELDLEEAIATVSYKSGGTQYTRTTFVSYPAKLMVIRLKADKKAKINLTAKLNSKLRHQTKATVEGLRMQGQAPYTVAARDYFPEQVVYDANRGMQFDVQVGFELRGGTVVPQDSVLRIENADEVVFYLAEATNFSGFDKEPGADGRDAGKIAEANLQEGKRKGFDHLIQEHAADYQQLFNRVSFALRGGSKYDHLPTNERLKHFTKHGDDLGLQTIYYQFGRYLLISSSRPGSRPANLQGIWNDHVQPPWGSNYTININTEMNYWLAENTNLSECHQPLLNFIKELAVNGAKTAKANYGINEGWMAHHNSDLWAKTSPVGHFEQDKTYYPQAFCWQMGGAWMSTHLWEHFLYTQDTAFLKKEGYPLIKGAALFMTDWLVKDPETGYLVTAPSTSPENLFAFDGKKYAIGKGTAMDMAIVRELFKVTIKASEVLDEDVDFRMQLNDKLNQLYPTQIGRYGQIQEWFDDIDDPEDTHRHISQLYGLFPGTEIDIDLTPKLAKAAETTLIHRGDVSTGWSMAWKINWWARLRDGNHAYSILEKAFNYINPADTSIKSTGAGGTYPNLFDAHPPFQIDGNFGATAGMTEMLMQSHNGIIDLLPALPEAWPSGHIKGIKARGNFEIGMTWEKGKIVHLTIKSLAGGFCAVRSDSSLHITNLPANKQERVGNIVRFVTEKGKTYVLR